MRKSFKFSYPEYQNLEERLVYICNSTCYIYKPVIDGIRNKKKKEEQEFQNTVTLKSGGKCCTRKFEQFQEYE